MAEPAQRPSVTKSPTGIEGFDHISLGGIPTGRTTLVSGSAGSAKTIFAAQFLAEGIRQYDQAGVFVTFEESAADIRANVSSLGWDVADWEAAGKWAFVDAAPQPGDEVVVSGAFDLGALVVRVEAAVRRTGRIASRSTRWGRSSPASRMR
jgi:circadian clock protein KaiC|nr:ATPase domain-containing protein [uncultured Lamprocystis sp.]